MGLSSLASSIKERILSIIDLLKKFPLLKREDL